MQFDPRRSCRVWGRRHELLWPLLLFDYSLQSDSNALSAASCGVSAVWVGLDEGRIKVIGFRSKIFQVQSELFMPPYQHRHFPQGVSRCEARTDVGFFCALMSLRSDGDKWLRKAEDTVSSIFWVFFSSLTWPQVKNLTLLSTFNMFKVYLYTKRMSFEDKPVCGCSNQYGLVHD